MWAAHCARRCQTHNRLDKKTLIVGRRNGRTVAPCTPTDNSSKRLPVEASPAPAQSLINILFIWHMPKLPDRLVNQIQLSIADTLWLGLCAGRLASRQPGPASKSASDGNNLRATNPFNLLT